jgi:FKBP-type peptidyl-prolyl cis-trans isomerase
MVTRWIITMLIGLLAGASAAGQDAPRVKAPGQTAGVQNEPTRDDSALLTAKDRRSYALGMDLARQFRNNLVEIDPDVLSKGLKDALSGGKTLLTEEEERAAVAELQADMKRRIVEAKRMGAEDNKKAGEAFLAENKKKEGVVTLHSGLQYKILKAGVGKKPTIDDTVVCQYRGTLVNGVQFDSSYDRGQPATFPVKGVIKGWTEALQLMPAGSTWQLVIPPELAYGEQGSGQMIGPDATLIFEVELISIQAKP